MFVKRIGKSLLSRIFEAQVKQLRKKNDIKVIAVVGSVGKTTTKLAIVKMLQPQIKLQHQNGNYNDRLTVPLVFFGQEQPGIYDIVQWVKVWLANRRLLSKPYPYDVVVLELGSDGPGQLQKMAYVNPDILVVTALTDEHMQYFKTIDAVAAEELSAAAFSKQVLINTDDSPAQYLTGIQHLSYGQNAADYTLVATLSDTDGRQNLQVSFGSNQISLQTSLLGLPGAKAVLAATAVADLCGLTPEQIVHNAPAIAAHAGRMQLLQGTKDSIIIDDTYNASPVAMKAALDALYDMPSTQRIAVLGSMNEMGDLSPDMHREVGDYCDPQKLSLVVTIGKDATTYLAPAATARGCEVKTFVSPYEAGNFLKDYIQTGAAILVKGSQNGVFSEEAVKLLLADPADAQKLVRQSIFWMNKKKRQFGRQAR